MPWSPGRLCRGVAGAPCRRRGIYVRKKKKEKEKKKNEKRRKIKRSSPEHFRQKVYRTPFTAVRFLEGQK